jgi:hypothetical protein
MLGSVITVDNDIHENSLAVWFQQVAAHAIPHAGAMQMRSH